MVSTQDYPIELVVDQLPTECVHGFMVPPIEPLSRSTSTAVFFGALLKVSANASPHECLTHWTVEQRRWTKLLHYSGWKTRQKCNAMWLWGQTSSSTA